MLWSPTLGVTNSKREVVERHDTFAAESSKRVRNDAAYFGQTSDTFPSHAPVILDFEAGIVRNVGDDSARQYIHKIHCIGPIECDVGQRCRVHIEDLQTGDVCCNLGVRVYTTEKNLARPQRCRPLPYLLY